MAEASEPLPGAPPDAPGLAAEIRQRLGPARELGEWPLVSIVVLNRDGAPLLRRLLRGLVEQTDYPNFELILVDNASSDDSLEFIRRAEAPFPISIVANPHNESFSDACNQGAELASGELLLFLNNDIEPFEAGWLRELVACLRGREAAAASATLVCLEEEHERSFGYGYGVQHRGLAFREEEDGMIHPVLHGWEADPLDERLGEDEEPPAVAAACVIVPRRTFDQVGGFSHGYVYGAEDVDLCLKLRSAGRSVICSGRSVAIHYPVSTRRIAPFEEERARKLANRRVLWERWGPLLRREYERRRGAGAAVAPPSVCLKVAEPDRVARLDPKAIVGELRSRGHASLLLEGDRAEDAIGLNYDVAVHLSGRTRYIPKPGQLNVLCIPAESPGRNDHEDPRYDVVLRGAVDANIAGRLDAEVLQNWPRRPVEGRLAGRSSQVLPVD